MSYLVRDSSYIDPAGTRDRASSAADAAESFELFGIKYDLVKPPPLCSHQLTVSRDEVDQMIKILDETIASVQAA